MLLATMLLVACGGEASGPSSSGAAAGTPREGALGVAPRNLMLITLDTTRADRIGAYGYEAARTPSLDLLASRGVLFTRAYAHAPVTVPTHASIMTGTFPPEHGLHDNTTALGTELPTLAEIFRERGCRTAAFIAGAPLDRMIGLNRGFDVYDDCRLESGPEFATRLERPADQIVDLALEWLGASELPFFVWVHLYDTHAPYEPPSGFEMADPYDGEIAFMDSQVGRLSSWLEEREIAEDTLVLAIGDHGEGLGDHGVGTHGPLIYEETQHVPLIVSWPGRLEAGLVIEDPVQQADVLPTLMDVYGLPIPEQVSGRSFAPLLAGEELEPQPLYIESDYGALGFGWSTLRGVVLGDRKYIQAPTPELYDLSTDPREKNNLAEREPEEVQRLDELLGRLRERMHRYERGDVEDRHQLEKALASLGYVQGSSVEDCEFGDSSVNPVEVVEAFNLFERAVQLGADGREGEMAGPLEQAAAVSPESASIHALLGGVYGKAGRTAEALEQLTLALELEPLNDTALNYISRAYLAAGDVDQARIHLELAVASRPHDISRRQLLARVLASVGELDGAVEQCREIVEREPDQALHWVDYADLLKTRGSFPEAAVALERALALDSQRAELQSYYAWFLATVPDGDVRNGELAVEIARRLVDSMPVPDARALDVLAAALAEAGQFEQARQVARRAIAAARSLGDAALLEALAGRLELYEQDRPFREG